MDNQVFLFTGAGFSQPFLKFMVGKNEEKLSTAFLTRFLVDKNTFEYCFNSFMELNPDHDKNDLEKLLPLQNFCKKLYSFYPNLNFENLIYLLEKQCHFNASTP